MNKKKPTTLLGDIKQDIAKLIPSEQAMLLEWLKTRLNASTEPLPHWDIKKQVVEYYKGPEPLRDDDPIPDDYHTSVYNLKE